MPCDTLQHITSRKVSKRIVKPLSLFPTAFLCPHNFPETPGSIILSSHKHLLATLLPIPISPHPATPHHHVTFQIPHLSHSLNHVIPPYQNIPTTQSNLQPNILYRHPPNPPNEPLLSHQGPHHLANPGQNKSKVNFTLSPLYCHYSPLHKIQFNFTQLIKLINQHPLSL